MNRVIVSLKKKIFLCCVLLNISRILTLIISEMQQYVEMVKRGDESLEERYQLFVRRKEIVLEEMRQLEKTIRNN